MPPHTFSSASAASGSNKAKNKPVQTHNANHTLRAGSRQKASQLQRSAQSRQPLNAQASDAASGSSLSLDQLDIAAPQQAIGNGTTTVASGPVTTSSSAKGKQREGQPAKNAAVGPKAGTQPQRKQVFKQVLSSPLTVNWPALPAVEAQPILYTLLDLLAHPDMKPLLRQGRTAKEGAQDRRCMSRGQRRQARKSRRAARDGAGGSVPDQRPGGSGRGHEASDKPGPRRLLCGINTVTRHMELMIAGRAAARRELKSSLRAGGSHAARTKPREGVGAAASSSIPAQALEPTTPMIRVVFVCQRDLDPPKLAAHFPMLACAVNAVCHPREDAASQHGATSGKREGGNGVVLVPLPEGAELLLCNALGVRRCAALALCFGPEDDLDAMLKVSSTATESTGMDVDPSSGTSSATSAPDRQRPPLRSVVHSLWQCVTETGTALHPLRATWLDAAAESVLGAVPASLPRPPAVASAPRLSPAPVVMRNVVSTAPANLNAHKLAKKHTRQEKKAWRKGKKREAHEAAKKAVRVERKGRREARRTQKREAAVERGASTR